jgi:hypothetical protein
MMFGNRNIVFLRSSFLRMGNDGLRRKTRARTL